MNKKEIEIADAICVLKVSGLKDGTRVYAKVSHASASGMSRNIELYIVAVDKSIFDISMLTARVLEWRFVRGYKGGVVVKGCGMDMILHTVDCLSREMGYGALCQNSDERVVPIKKNDKKIGLRLRYL